MTVLGTASNNAISVPLRAIAADLDVPIAAAVLAVTSFLVVFAVMMPFAGWLAERIGPRRTLILALGLLVVGQLASALAPNLGFLVATRAMQGLACSTIPPIVMKLLVDFYPDRRLLMMSGWAAANGIGHAIGPPLGGIVTDAWGWRVTFIVLAVWSLGSLASVLRWVPRVGSIPTELDLRTAALLAVGVGAILISFNMLGLQTIDRRHVGALFAVGAGLVWAFFATSKRSSRPLINPDLYLLPAYVRGCVASFAQMFTFGTALVGLPLYMGLEMNISAGQIGLIMMTMPLVMVGAVPLVNRLAQRVGVLTALVTGMCVVLAADLGGAALISSGRVEVEPALIAAVIVMVGLGMAMVQTPSATGVVLSPAGNHGGALGIFNMIRFSGSTAGAGWVAISYPMEGAAFMFVGAGVVAAAALTICVMSARPLPDAGTRRSR